MIATIDRDMRENVLEYLQNEHKLNIMLTQDQMKWVEDAIPEGIDDHVIFEQKHKPIPLIDDSEFVEVPQRNDEDEFELMELEAQAIILKMKMLKLRKSSLTGFPYRKTRPTFISTSKILRKQIKLNF